MRHLFIALVVAACSGCVALKDPNVWAPVAAAALLQINDADEQISDYLYEETPVFGDVENAKDWSDNFRTYTTASYVLTGAAMPLDLDAKVVLLTLEWASVEAVDHVRGDIQESIERDRPDGSNSNSMPSGHTTTAAYQAQLAELNISYLNIDDSTKEVMDFTVNAFAALAGYARIEAGRHYPTDVLMGWSLGNLFGNMAKVVATPGIEASIIPVISKDTTGVQAFILF